MNTFNPQDMERLHAYLDGELSPQDRAAFEAKVQQDANLSAALARERQFRASFRARLRQPHAPVLLQAVVQVNASPTPTRWQTFLSWWLTPKAMRPSMVLAGVFLWSVLLVGVVWGTSLRTSVTIQQFISKHELYFEGKPSLDMTGSHEEVNDWIAYQAPFDAKAPDLGKEWRVEGARLDDLLETRMIDILYFKDSGLDASLSIFEAKEYTFSEGKQVTYGGNVYYVTDDGWHRTIVWTADGVGYALVGNLVISSEELFSMAAVVRNQFE